MVSCMGRKCEVVLELAQLYAFIPLERLFSFHNPNIDTVEQIALSRCYSANKSLQWHMSIHALEIKDDEMVSCPASEAVGRESLLYKLPELKVWEDSISGLHSFLWSWESVREGRRRKTLTYGLEEV